MSFRHWVAGLAFGATLLAQQGLEQTSTWTIDVNGHRVEGFQFAATESPSRNQRVETLQTINGRMTPVQSAEDHVIRQDSQGKVVDRVIRKYDGNGNPASSIKVHIEETRNPDGTITVQSSSYESDVNGNMHLFERATSQIRKGDTTETTTTVERATLNGALETTVRNTSVERKTATGSQVDTMTYRRDVSGNFMPFAQDVKQISKSGSEETADATHYELDPDNKLKLASRAIEHVRTNADGSQVSDTEVYSKFSPGHTSDVNAEQPRLQEQVRRERSAGPAGAIVEITSVRGRLPNNPSTFGAYEKATQVIYTSTDASGREVKSTTTTIGRVGPNGQIVPEEGRADHSVTTKK